MVFVELSTNELSKKGEELLNLVGLVERTRNQGKIDIEVGEVGSINRSQ